MAIKTNKITKKNVQNIITLIPFLDTIYFYYKILLQRYLKLRIICKLHQMAWPVPGDGFTALGFGRESVACV